MRAGYLIALAGVDDPTAEQYRNAREELLTEIEYAAQLEGLGESDIRGAMNYALAHYRVDGRRIFNDVI